MSSSVQGSSDNYHGRVIKHEKQTRRSWSPEEEKSLLAGLKGIVASGWKADNSFKQGYLLRLEDHMKKEFPNTDLRSTPHINSKVQTWKRNYNSLCLMTSRSGAGFNGHQIDCNDDQWETIVKRDPNVKMIRYKSWPMFEEWKEIFGKDRATGDAAKDVIDVVNDMVEEDNRAEFAKDTRDLLPSVEDIFVDNDVVNSVCHTEHGDATNKSSGKEDHGETSSKVIGKGKKRKSTELGNQVVELLGDITRGAYARLDAIASRIGQMCDVDQGNTEAFGLVESISGLSEEEQFQVCDIFADKPERLTISKRLPEHKKLQYVRHLLNTKPT